MAKLEGLKRGSIVKGVVSGGNVTVVDVEWHGTDAITLVYRREDGSVADRLVFRDDEVTLPELVEAEVVAHLAGLMNSNMRVTLEIEAYLAEPARENVVRTVSENCRTLKFKSHGFETE